MAWRHALLVLVLFLSACAEPRPQQPLAGTPAPPQPTATPEPTRPEDAAQAFFSAWQQGHYPAMYDLVATSAQAITPRDVFIRRYTNIHDGVGETKVAVQPSGPATTVEGAPDRVEEPFEVVHTLAVYGEVRDSNRLPLVAENGVWKVDWQPGLIFSGLTASSTVRVAPEVPTRGRILDRNGEPLADNGSILAIGVVPGQIKDEGALLDALSEVLGLARETIKQRYQGGQPTWFMPITQRSEDERPDLEARLGSIAGVSLQDKPARVYPLGPAAAHIVGYVGHPTADELQKLAPAGYEDSDWVGRAGIEASAEQQLAGSRGGTIQIVDSGSKVVRTIAQKAAVNGADVTLTLDSAIQHEALAALGDKIGSAVVMDPRDRSLLALVSQPSFDPNQFVIGLTDEQWQELNGPNRPLVLRATESAYPTGSIFKVITLAAGLETGVVKTSETFNCGLDWNGLPGVTLHNWEAQGTLRLTEALTESCNPAFYEIGLRLDQRDPTILPSFARMFGLGSPTGMVGVHEVDGTVPDPTWKQTQLKEPWTTGDAVNLAIGQGYLLATPLQMANAYASLTDGVVSAPRLIKSVESHKQGTLKLASSTFAAIVEGMSRVTSTPQGTAAYAFRAEKLSIAAKTGSAENENPDAHAWFVGYTPIDKPTLLTLVMIEGGQHGGTVAAPVARSLIDFAYPKHNNR
jgi:penicillin-binding protein 2